MGSHTPIFIPLEARTQAYVRASSDPLIREQLFDALMARDYVLGAVDVEKCAACGFYFDEGLETASDGRTYCGPDYSEDCYPE